MFPVLPEQVTHFQGFSRFWLCNCEFYTIHCIVDIEPISSQISKVSLHLVSIILQLCYNRNTKIKDKKNKDLYYIILNPLIDHVQHLPVAYHLLMYLFLDQAPPPAAFLVILIESIHEPPTRLTTDDGKQLSNISNKVCQNNLHSVNLDVWSKNINLYT